MSMHLILKPHTFIYPTIILIEETSLSMSKSIKFLSFILRSILVCFNNLLLPYRIRSNINNSTVLLLYLLLLGCQWFIIEIIIFIVDIDIHILFMTLIFIELTIIGLYIILIPIRFNFMFKFPSISLLFVGIIWNWHDGMCIIRWGCKVLCIIVINYFPLWFLNVGIIHKLIIINIISMLIKIVVQIQINLTNITRLFW